jgi:hypothetical protein
MKEIKNLRKNQIGGWIFCALGSLALVHGLTIGRVSLLWLGLGVLGTVVALRSGRRLGQLKSGAATLQQSTHGQSPFLTTYDPGR